KTETIKVGSKVVGTRIKAKVVKNKVSAPFRSAEFDIMFDEGISKEGDLVDLGVEMGIIKKTGAFFSYDETRLGQGRENAKEFLKQHKDLAEEIERIIRSTASIHKDAQPFSTMSEPLAVDSTD
ncbi:MAG: DNA recombination/repair protein RecA, partial [Dehalococcoidia bacterium]